MKVSARLLACAPLSLGRDRNATSHRSRIKRKNASSPSPLSPTTSSTFLFFPSLSLLPFLLLGLSFSSSPRKPLELAVLQEKKGRFPLTPARFLPALLPSLSLAAVRNLSRSLHHHFTPHSHHYFAYPIDKRRRWPSLPTETKHNSVRPFLPCRLPSSRHTHWLTSIPALLECVVNLRLYSL
jgi:hypothetical protein